MHCFLQLLKRDKESLGQPHDILRLLHCIVILLLVELNLLELDTLLGPFTRTLQVVVRRGGSHGKFICEAVRLLRFVV